KAEEVKKLLEQVECGLTLDVGHANTFEKPEKFVRLLRNYIINVHVHDNDGSKDSHLPIGKGNINFEGLIKEINHNILMLIIECHSLEDISESLNYLRNNT
ncbi:sugar phosphate isomerase/epimerase, partial [Candidatus Bathyarchaeota archaeon]|nr:sugar phosphate isomerase/epimerase [Candidatus Bathyarchaeota archaeon]